jgi:4-aminobutyrate aminotransferase-like enzyme/Ser/Thr protein kinase RdoA (MazF antagonist)
VVTFAATAALRPRFDESSAAALALQLYGLTVTARSLPSERDQNFLLTTAPSAATGCERTILKIARAAERREELELQNEAMAWVREHDPTVAIPGLRPTLAGERIAEASGADGTHLVRLFDYLPGTVLAEARPQTPELLRSVGRFLGALDRALSGFSHPAAVDRDLVWDPKRAPSVIARYRDAIRDPAQRALVDHFLRLYEATAPKLAALRTSVIHNDANDYNILVGAPTPTGREVSGLLDFGDMVHGWTVAETAVAVVYAMLGKPDPLQAAAAVVAGYHSEMPLTEAEIEVILPLACARLCTSVCLSAHRRREEPENAYLTVSEAPAWGALAALREVHPRLAHYVLREACGLPPSPGSPAVVRWLREHAAALGPVVRADVNKGLVLDLSVGSPVSAEGGDVAAVTSRVAAEMAAAGADVAVGRYDEARVLYTTEAFATHEGDERRTVHVAIDLFLAPGSPVLACLPGRVHSFRNNAAPLDYGPTIILEHEPDGAPRFYTLYGHLSEDSLDGLRAGATVARGQVVARVGSPPSNGGWPPHVHFQIVTDLLDKEGEFPGVAAASRRAVWRSLSPDPNLILRIPEERLRLAEDGDPQALLDERRHRLGRNLSVAYGKPLKIARGAGARLYDHTGRAYLDAVNNVAHVGHCHPRVVRAGQRQMAVLNTNTRYLHDDVVRYARRLGETLPEPLRVCFFVNSGSEANELALRLARAGTGGRGVIVVEGSYHGNTTGLIDVSPYKFDGPGGEGAPPHVHTVPVPDDYRGLYRRDDPQRGERFADHVRVAAQELRGRGVRPAAFICESLLSVAGQIVPPPAYLAAAYAHAREAGAVCIADEVQVALGRVGSHFWGFEAQGALPDVVTVGKPIGNGHPLGAVITTAEIADAFANGMEYFNTFGGNPVSCAIGLAVLDVIRDEGLQERALRVGAHLKEGLERLREAHPVVGDVRGLGLFLGIELVLDPDSREPAGEKAAYVVERAKELGVLLSTDGPGHNVVKMKPPLVFSEQDADRVVAVLDEVLGEDFVRLRSIGSSRSA